MHSGRPFQTIVIYLVGVCVVFSVLFNSAACGQSSREAFRDAPAPGTIVPLWPEAAPQALGQEDSDKPTLEVFLPRANPTQTGVIVAPGGGYGHLSMQKEGTDIARWLNDRGVAAFVLKYRLGPRYRHPVELNDAKRAIRSLRANAQAYGLDPGRLGMWGFSAGGHLAATAGTLFDPGDAGAADRIDRQSSRPDFLILAYPVITMEEPAVHRGSRDNLLGKRASPALVEELSAEKHVTSATPPTFLFATTDDATVPVSNSVMFYLALVAAKVPAELHLFEQGPHGVGLAQGYPDLRIWPELLTRWMKSRGYMAGLQ